MGTKVWVFVEFWFVGFVEFWSVGFAEETSCLLSLVKTFDSVLSAYEGFCSLKQVNFVFRVAGCSFFFL